MISILKWVGERILAVCRWVGKLLGYVLNTLASLFSSVVTYILAAIAYVLDLVFGYISDLLQDVFSNLVSINLPSINVVPFAQWIAHDIVALDVAYTAFLAYFSVWVACKLTRGGWTGIRFLLDLL